MGNDAYGYAGSGLSGLDSGGSSGYSEIDAFYEQYNSIFSGEFEQVGDAEHFGYPILEPSGLTEHNGKLYVFGTSTSDHRFVLH